MKQSFPVSTRQKMELLDITAEVNRQLAQAGIQEGICLLYNPHTTAALTINEGADPAVQTDILGALRQMVPWDYPYNHAEGNSPAHLMASLVGSSVSVLVEGGKLVLGTWQRIFFCEFDGPRSRKIYWKTL